MILQLVILIFLRDAHMGKLALTSPEKSIEPELYEFVHALFNSYLA